MIWLAPNNCWRDWDKTYGEKLQSVVELKAKLLNMAEQRKAEAIALMEQGKFREARSAAIDMANISPDISGGPELVARIVAGTDDSSGSYAASQRVGSR